MYEFDGENLPRTTLVVDLDEDTGASTYFATCEIVGLEPNRGTTAEERIAGIESLDPPTVYATGVQDVMNLMWRAIEASAEASGLTGIEHGNTQVNVGRMRFSLAECFYQAGIDA